MQGKIYNDEYQIHYFFFQLTTKMFAVIGYTYFTNNNIHSTFSNSF